MPRYIAFLRAINVGGHVVKMDILRSYFETFGEKSTPFRGMNTIQRVAAKYPSSQQADLTTGQWCVILKLPFEFAFFIFLSILNVNEMKYHWTSERYGNNSKYYKNLLPDCILSGYFYHPLSIYSEKG